MATPITVRGGAARPAAVPEAGDGHAPGLAVYFLAGVLFGIILMKSEVVSWFRIQEMFRFQSFHMYGIFMTAVPTAAVSIALLKRLQARALSGEEIRVPRKVMGRGHRYWIGGLVFGMGWALTGACPGPLFALIGGGVTVMLVVAASAVAGAWLYGYLRPRLPH